MSFTHFTYSDYVIYMFYIFYDMSLTCFTHIDWRFTYSGYSKSLHVSHILTMTDHWHVSHSQIMMCQLNDSFDYDMSFTSFIYSDYNKPFTGFTYSMTGHLHVSQDHLHVSLCIIITGQLDFLCDIIALIKLSQSTGWPKTRHSCGITTLTVLYVCNILQL